MGIQGLLPFLAKSTRDAHISEFENMSVAIDAYCWLHKGIYSCSYELAMKKPTTKYITYCMRYVEMLLHFHVKPIFVFDGRLLSSKQETEKKRREERKKKRERGKELLRAGKTFEGRKLLGESLDVSHELALNLIKECREKNIDCIVAPFEADAQLAFLSLRNIVQCIITEDSDLLAYGCERVMFKMDNTGRGRLTEKSELHLSLNMSLEDFNEDIFRYMCILSGCDYLPSLPSIGPANALKFIKLLKDKDVFEALPRLPTYLNKMNVKVTSEYIEGFRVADNTFKHQLVYDPLLRTQVPLRPVMNEDDIVGLKLPEDVAFQLALGNIDPITMKTVDDFDPDVYGRGFSILWKPDFLPNTAPKLSFFNSSHSLIEAKKRQRDGVEPDSVQSIANDLKKQRLPLNTSTIKSFITNKKTPKTGFVFEPLVSGENKNVSKTKVDKSKLLSSRYFSRLKEKPQDKKPQPAEDVKRKDESYEEYLRRLYDEYFTNGSEKGTGLNNFCCKEQPDTSLCSSCRKCGKCCDCGGSDYGISDTQQLDKYIKEFEEHKESKKNLPVQESLLDKIYQNQEAANLSERAEAAGIEEETQKDISPGQSLSIDFSKILSKFDSPGVECDSREIKIVEKENKTDLEVICENSVERSPSPVFRVQKDSRVLNRTCRLGNISDTAATPTSVYFGGVNSASPTIKRRTSFTSLRKTSSNLKLGKNSVKGTPVNRTLFQFGFKKECKNEVEEGR